MKTFDHYIHLTEVFMPDWFGTVISNMHLDNTLDTKSANITPIQLSASAEQFAADPINALKVDYDQNRLYAVKLFQTVIALALDTHKQEFHLLFIEPDGAVYLGNVIHDHESTVFRKTSEVKV